MKQGIEDVVLAFSICSAVLVISDLLDRRDARARAREIDAKLDKIDKGIEKLHATAKR